MGVRYVLAPQAPIETAIREKFAFLAQTPVDPSGSIVFTPTAYPLLALLSS
jgi:hypothetical protein